jgi:hypothetical protein
VALGVPPDVEGGRPATRSHVVTSQSVRLEFGPGPPGGTPRLYGPAGRRPPPEQTPNALGLRAQHVEIFTHFLIPKCASSLLESPAASDLPAPSKSSGGLLGGPVTREASWTGASGHGLPERRSETRPVWGTAWKHSRIGDRRSVSTTGVVGSGQMRPCLGLSTFRNIATEDGR